MSLGTPWDHLQYLALMGACVLITLPLEFVLAARVYRRARTALLAIAPVALLFGAWDLLGIARAHWWYDPRYITGIHLGPIPLEELVFFVVIPLCALLTFEAVGTVLRSTAALRRRREGGERA